jgi:hypothetical protein
MAGLGVLVELSSVIAGDKYANRRRQFGQLMTDVAVTTGGLIVVSALGYGIASEGRRLTGAARSTVAGRLSGK